MVLLTLAAPARAQTATPIEHLIVVVGENLSFDNLFGVYRPRSNADIRNLLSQGIVNRDGEPGPEFTRAAQRRAEVRDTYQVTPRIIGTYGELPRPGTNNWYSQSGYSSGSYTNCSDANAPGAKAIQAYLKTLPYPAFNNGNCEPGADYLVNNYNAGLLSTFDPAPLGPQVFRIPSQPNPTIAEALSRKGNLKVVFRRT